MGGSQEGREGFGALGGLWEGCSGPRGWIRVPQLPLIIFRRVLPLLALMEGVLGSWGRLQCPGGGLGGGCVCLPVRWHRWARAPPGIAGGSSGAGGAAGAGGAGIARAAAAPRPPWRGAGRSAPAAPRKTLGGGGGTTQGEGGGHLIACMDTPTKRAGRGSPGGWRGHAQQRVAGNNPKNGGGGGIGDTQRIRVNMGIPHKVKIGNRGHKKLGADLGDKKKV